MLLRGFGVFSLMVGTLLCLLTGAFEGWQKAVVVGGATLLTANLPN